MSPAQTLPKKGDKVYAWVPKLHKEVAATVEAVRGSKLTVTVYTGDNGLEKFSGIERWKPAGNGKLKGEQLPLPDPIIEAVETPAAVDDYEDWTDWEKQNYSWLKDAEYCKHEGENKKIEKFLPGTKSLRLEGMQAGKEYLKIWEVEPAEEPSKNFDPINSTYEIAIADIWPTEKDFEEGTDEAAALQPRNRIDADTVNRYVEIFDALPPIDVFKVEGQTGYCLAGGWHRRAAAIKLGKKEIRANVHTGTIEEAVLFAAMDNLQSGLQLTKSEVEEACKNFLKIAHLLPASKVDSLVAEVNRKFGKQATELSNVVVALMFGVSDRTISNYKKDLECEKLMAAFEVGQRVEVVSKAYENVEPTYRRGKISHKNRYKLFIKSDFEGRCLEGGFDPTDVIATDEPKAAVEIAESFAPGDKIKHWKTGLVGVVASVDWDNSDWIWSFCAVSPANPIVLFDKKLEVADAKHFDLVSTSEPPTLEECLLVTRYQLESVGENDPYNKRKLAGRLALLEKLANPEPAEPTAETVAADAPAQPVEPTPAVKSVTTEMGATPAPAPTPTELKTFTNAKAEVEAKGKQLGLNGSGKQQLPDIEKKEDPVIIGAKPAAAARKASLTKEVIEIIDEAAPDENEALEIFKVLLKYLPEDYELLI